MVVAVGYGPDHTLRMRDRIVTGSSHAADTSPAAVFSELGVTKLMIIEMNILSASTQEHLVSPRLCWHLGGPVGKILHVNRNVQYL